MNPEDRETIIGWAGKLSRPAKIGLAGDQSRAGALIAEFARELTTLAPGIGLENEPDGVPARPALITGRFDNIYYQAIPAGPILPAFLNTIAGSNATIPSPDTALAAMLSKLRTPMPLKLYIGPGCPFCPEMAGRLLMLADSTALVRLIIIDAATFSSRAAADGVRSVPHTILDQQFSWTGVVDPAEILEMGISRDPARMSPGCLRQLLEDGKAHQVAEMMAKANRIFPALADLLAHPRWSVRLGAMVVVEYLAAGNSQLAAGLCRPLWERFQVADEQARGDIVYTLGQIGTAEAARYIRQVLKDPAGRQVKEAAREALAEIEKNSSG